MGSPAAEMSAQSSVTTVTGAGAVVTESGLVTTAAGGSGERLTGGTGTTAGDGRAPHAEIA